MSWANYFRVAATVENGGGRSLSGLSVGLILHALSLIESYEHWHNDDYEELTDSEWDVAQAAIDNAIDEVMTEVSLSGGNGVIVGEIKAVATSTVPSGFLLCDGSSYLRVDYPDLYAVLDIALITDADNFVVPDLRDRFIMGLSGTSVINDTGGEATHALTESELPSHAHTLTHQVAAAFGTLNGALSGGSTLRIRSEATDPVGGNVAHNNLPPYTVLRYVIATQNS